LITFIINLSWQLVTLIKSMKKNDTINQLTDITLSKQLLEPQIPLFAFENGVNAFENGKLENKIICGDCEQIINLIPNNSVDLIFTSPPYADQRKNTYGGITPDKYVEWFMPKVKEFHRVLKPSGTFILNIKERVVNGERHTYVLELILEMKRNGWFWTEEWIWHKKNSHPGKWNNRFRDNWERLLQFNKSRKFAMYQDEVMVPVGGWANNRLKNLSETDKSRDNSKVGSGFGKNISNWVGREKVYPSNVLHMATECYNRGHPATFPISLPDFFIKLFTKENDLVLDPFSGSGTTLISAKTLNRRYIGIEIVEEYCDLAKKRIQNGEVDETT